MSGHGPVTAPVQATGGEAILRTIASVVAYFPTALGAILLLPAGYVVGRVLGGVVTRASRRIGIGRRVRATPLEGVPGGDDPAGTAGTFVAYYAYSLAVLVAVDALDVLRLSAVRGDPDALAPVVLGALILLVVGFVGGRIVGEIVADAVAGIRADAGPALQDTPLERLAEEGRFGRPVGTVVSWCVYLVTLVAVANLVEIGAVATLLDAVAGHLPVLAGGLVALLVGIRVAERVGVLIVESDESRTAGPPGLAVIGIAHCVTIAVALDTIGVDTAVLTDTLGTFVAAFVGALALALGVADGLGG